VIASSIANPSFLDIMNLSMRSSGLFSRSRDLNAEKINAQKYSEAITLNLNGNKLTFIENQWIVQSEDLDRAANEIDCIMEERDELVSSLKEMSLHTDALNKEIIETNDMKNVALGMVNKTCQCLKQIAHHLTCFTSKFDGSLWKKGRKTIYWRKHWEIIRTNSKRAIR
jgi:hypothetical protein